MTVIKMSKKDQLAMDNMDRNDVLTDAERIAVCVSMAHRSIVNFVDRYDELVVALEKDHAKNVAALSSSEDVGYCVRWNGDKLIETAAKLDVLRKFAHIPRLLLGALDDNKSPLQLLRLMSEVESIEIGGISSNIGVNGSTSLSMRAMEAEAAVALVKMFFGSFGMGSLWSRAKGSLFLALNGGVE